MGSGETHRHSFWWNSVLLLLVGVALGMIVHYSWCDMNRCFDFVPTVEKKEVFSADLVSGCPSVVSMGVAMWTGTHRRLSLRL